MSTVPSRFPGLRRVGVIAFYLNLLGSLATIGFGVFTGIEEQDALRGAGIAAAGICALVLGTLLYCQLVLVQKFVSNSYRLYDAILEMCESLRRQVDHARTIAENSTLSDWAKRAVYREKDYEFLRDTIQAAIVRQDWEAAEHLIRDLDQQLGYHDEADFCRQELAKARRATNDERIAAALARFEQVCGTQKWAQAKREAERLRALFPDDPRIANLPREVEIRRQDYKRKLLRDYEQALRTHDVDTAHKLLIELDQYLAPSEADSLKESARGVFRAKLEQLRAEFSIAISYRQFRTAVEVGGRLIQEFPNSGYAQEISKMMPVLRKRAEQETPQHAPAVSS